MFHDEKNLRTNVSPIEEINKKTEHFIAKLLRKNESSYAFQMVFFRKNIHCRLMECKCLIELSPEHDIFRWTLSDMCMGKIINRMNIIEILNSDDQNKAKQKAKFYFEFITKMFQFLSAFLMF